MDEKEEKLYRDALMNLVVLRGHYDQLLRISDDEHDRPKTKGKIDLVQVIMKFMRQLSEEMGE